MNIWILTSEYSSVCNSEIGIYCVEACEAWVSQGHTVTVFVPTDSDQQPFKVQEINELHRIVHVPISPSLEIEMVMGHWHLLSYCMAEAIISYIRSGNSTPDFIEIQDYAALGYFLIKRKCVGARELKDIRMIIYVHTPIFELTNINQEPSYIFPNYWIAQCEKFCLRAADAVISPSLFLKKRLEQEVNKDIEVIPYPYSGTLQSGKKSLGLSVQKYDYVYVGGLEYRKGVLQLLQGFRNLWDAGHDIKLKIVADNAEWFPKKVEIKSLIERTYRLYIDLGFLTLAGPVSDVPLTDIFASAKFVVLPFLYENFPYVCMQAMAAGRPILSSSSGGQAELIGSEGLQGQLFSWDQPTSLEKAILDLLSKSPDELEEMGKNAVYRIREFCSPDKFIRARINSFEKIISRDDKENDIYPFDERYLPSCVERERASGRASEIQGRISVIVPFFNLAAYLPDTLNSIENSDYHDLEIIIVNDGSTESESLLYLESLKRDKPQITIIDIENAGLANARNIGAQSASGEYIAFLDADDCVDPTYYSKCAAVLDRYCNVSFVYSWVRYFGESSGLWVNFDAEFPYLLASNMLAAFQVVRRNDYLDSGMNDKDMIFGMEDYEAVIRMLTHGYRGVSIPEPLSQYRVRHDSMSREFRRGAVLYMYEQIAKKNLGIYNKFGAELFMLINANGPGYLWNNPMLSYPQVGYDGHVTKTSHGDFFELFSSGDLIRLKSIATKPIFSKIIKFILLMKLDRWFRG